MIGGHFGRDLISTRGKSMLNLITDLKSRLLNCIKLVQGPLKTPCWEWQGSKVTGGYGNLTFRCESMYAHRASWIVHFGPIPVDQNVCHRCDYRSCINPEHLFLGTQEVNLQDMINKGRKVQSSILTKEQAIQIKQMLKSGEYSQYHIANLFGVSRSTIQQIHLGNNWKDVG